MHRTPAQDPPHRVTTSDTLVIPLCPPSRPGVDIDVPEREEEPGKFANIRNPTLTLYEPAADRRTGAAVVICPGGGYGMVSCVNEGYPVARWLQGLGVFAAILKYRLPGTPGVDYRHPVPLSDVQRALRMVRGMAPARGFDPGRIGIVGFSAGGHLAATACTLFDRPVDADPVDGRPDFSILVYPVISFVDPCCHGGSRLNLLGTDDSTDPRCASLSPERRVSPDTPPAFLVHAKNDPCVPYRNSELYRDALRQHGVPVELVLYEDGAHGFGLGAPHQDAARWPADAETWLRRRGILS